MARRNLGRQCAIRRDQRLPPGFFGGQVAECGQALGGQFQHTFARSVGILEHAFQVVLQAADHVGKMRQLCLAGHGLIHHQLFVDVIGTAAHQARRARQRNHRQSPTHLAEQLGQRLQALAIPVSFNAVNH